MKYSVLLVVLVSIVALSKADSPIHVNAGDTQVIIDVKGPNSLLSEASALESALSSSSSSSSLSESLSGSLGSSSSLSGSLGSSLSGSLGSSSSSLSESLSGSLGSSSLSESLSGSLGSSSSSSSSSESLSGSSGSSSSSQESSFSLNLPPEPEAAKGYTSKYDLSEDLVQVAPALSFENEGCVSNCEAEQDGPRAVVVGPATLSQPLGDGTNDLFSYSVPNTQTVVSTVKTGEHHHHHQVHIPHHIVHEVHGPTPVVTVVSDTHGPIHIVSDQPSLPSNCEVDACLSPLEKKVREELAKQEIEREEKEKQKASLHREVVEHQSRLEELATMMRALKFKYSELQRTHQLLRVHMASNKLALQQTTAPDEFDIEDKHSTTEALKKVDAINKVQQDILSQVSSQAHNSVDHFENSKDGVIAALSTPIGSGSAGSAGSGSAGSAGSGSAGSGSAGSGSAGSGSAGSGSAGSGSAGSASASAGSASASAGSASASSASASSHSGSRFVTASSTTSTAATSVPAAPASAPAAPVAHASAPAPTPSNTPSLESQSAAAASDVLRDAGLSFF